METPRDLGFGRKDNGCQCNPGVKDSFGPTSGREKGQIMAMQQATVVFTGYVGTDPVLRGPEGNEVASFRVGSTRSYFNREQNRWVDFPTTWLTVKAFRSLAANARNSLHVGDPVIVAGLLNTDQWTNEQGEERSMVVLEASAIGHDINFGASSFRKFEKPRQSTQRGIPNASKAPDPFAQAPDSVPADSTASIPAPTNMSSPSEDVPPAF